MNSDPMKRRMFLTQTAAGGALLAASATAMEPPYRVGIVGTDNSHSGAFAKLLNVDKAIPGAEAAAMYGRDAARTKEMAAAGNVKTIVSDPSEMFDLVNVAFVVFRHGDLHAEYALPFIEKGIPTFVDKPFALKTKHARMMIDAAKKHGTYLTSYSTARWGEELSEFMEGLKHEGEIYSAGTIGPGSADSEYGGFGFYGIHSIELLTHAAIYDRVAAVSASREGNRIAGTVFAESGKLYSIQVAPGVKGFRAVVEGEFRTHTVRTGGSYANGLKVFFKGLRSNQPPLPYETLFEQTAIIEAMEKSMAQNGVKVAVESL